MQIEWLEIGLSLVNEYNTEGLFDMDFPTLFPTRIADWLQPRLANVRIDEYALHLLKYCDHRFGKNPRFRYYLLNTIMIHHSQENVVVFV